MTGRPVLNFFRVASLVLLLLVVALLSAIATMQFAIHGAEVQIPVAQGDDRSRCAQPDLRPGARFGRGQPLLLRGSCRRTHSFAVARRRAPWCGGSGGCGCPKAWGRKRWKCRTRWAGRACGSVAPAAPGLEVGVTARLPYAKAPEGPVLAQEPPPHAQGIARPSVNLLVAAPDEEPADGFAMADLTGLPVASAQAALAKVGIKTAATSFVSAAVAPVGSAGVPPKLPVKPGTVTAQQPQAGTRIEQNAAVKLTVAK